MREEVLSLVLSFAPLALAAIAAVTTYVLLAGPGRTESSALARRARSILQDAVQQERRKSILRHPLAWLSGKLALDEWRQKAIDWIWDRSTFGKQRRVLLRQAGLRAPRMYLYFEGVRALLAILLAAGTFLFLSGMPRGPGGLATVALTVLAFAVGIYLPEGWLKRRIAARRRAFGDYWDDAIGLLIICLDSGLSIEVAMRRIAQELAPVAPILAEEFVITVADLSLLKERRMAYVNLSQRIDLPGVKSVTIALVQAEKQGASIAHSLRTIWAANRQARLANAEARAASLGPKMTVPMIVFFLPVLFVVIIAPIVLTADF
ncbi:type II secretion system F family protein [Rhodobacteraceae bacterium HSP-20]|uniref:Type II secretion system F family protein n=1 Tax=Paragemmobacter amnigenus TaxID=2852097 RepID=A0ABS6J3S8_9RHOB|nr:type II secretion system F family protein [Rhodobacter amnigenus]MBU9697529.1 type II secretion system F family protein [Rhodobacter amnigenus]MBV4388756.1 type II secretion system F family protein [Rhodobacter amnigenus]